MIKPLIALVTLAGLIVGCATEPGSDVLSAEVLRNDDGTQVCKTITVDATEYVDIETASECPVKAI